MRTRLRGGSGSWAKGGIFIFKMGFLGFGFEGGGGTGYEEMNFPVSLDTLFLGQKGKEVRKEGTAELWV